MWVSIRCMFRAKMHLDVHICICTEDVCLLWGGGYSSVFIEYYLEPYTYTYSPHELITYTLDRTSFLQLCGLLKKKKKGCTHRFPVFFFVDQKLSCLYTYIVAIKMIALLPSSPRCFHVFNAASALQDRKPVAWSAVWYSLCTTYSHEKKSHFLCLVLYSKDAKATGTTHYDLTCYNMNARLWWAVLGWIA